MNKMFERTENGTTTVITAADALAEANHAMMAGQKDVKTMSAGSGRYDIEYKDGRKVRLVRIDAPAEQPAETAERPDAWTVASHRMLLHRFTQADENGRALCNKGFRPWRYGNGYVFKTKAEHQSGEYAHLYTFCPRCEAK